MLLGALQRPLFSPALPLIGSRETCDDFSCLGPIPMGSYVHRNDSTQAPGEPSYRTGLLAEKWVPDISASSGRDSNSHN